MTEARGFQTVGQMQAQMPNREYHTWRAIYAIRSAKAEAENAKMSSRKGKRRAGR